MENYRIYNNINKECSCPLCDAGVPIKQVKILDKNEFIKKYIKENNMVIKEE